MGIWQTLSGRTTPRRPALDALFGIPGAAITLETAMDFAPTGIGAVCYRKAEGSFYPFAPVGAPEDRKSVV